MRRWRNPLAIGLSFVFAGCSGGSAGNAYNVSPSTAALTLSQSQQFTASAQSGVILHWSVDGIVGGNSSVGTITGGGLYVAPATPGVHTVTATNNADSTQHGTATAAVTDLKGIFTYHNDLARTGQNLQEYVLTPISVSPLFGSKFGKRWSCAVDGEVYAQPLYIANLSIGGGSHNVLIVATQHDSVYAIDADDSRCHTYWQVSFLGAGVTSMPAADTQCPAISTEIGITGTPVIDPTSGTLYLVAATK